MGLGVFHVCEDAVGLGGHDFGFLVIGELGGGLEDEGFGVREDLAGGNAEGDGLNAEKVEVEIVGGWDGEGEGWG